MWRKVWHLAKQTGTEFLADNAMRLGAALAFYTALSLSPLLLIVIALAGLVYGEEAARGELVGQLQGLIGDEGAKTVETMLANSRRQDTGIWSAIVGLVTLVAGATGVFSQLQDALNAMWEAPEQKTGGGIWATVRDKLLSFSMVCGMAFLLLASLVFSAIVQALGASLQAWLPMSIEGLGIANFVLSTALTFLMFAMIFKLLPRTRPKWSDVWIGAAVTALLFTVGKYLIGLYLGQAAVGSTFGAAGSFVVLLMWLYYSSLILLFGAEFTQVYAKLHGSGAGKATGREGAGPPVYTISGKPSIAGVR